MCPYPSNPFQQIVESKERTRCTRNKFSFIPSPYCLLHVIDPSIWMPGKGREANSFPRAKLEENCELRGTDNVQGQISEHIFKVKWRVLCLLSFKYFLQYASSASLSYVNHVKVFQLASKISTSFNSDFASVESICLRKKYTILRWKKIIPWKTKARYNWGQGYRESNHLSRTRSRSSHSVKCVNRRERNWAAALPFWSFYLVFSWSSTLCWKYNCGLIDQPKTTCEEVEAEPAVEKNATEWFCWERFLCSWHLTLNGASNKVAHNRWGLYLLLEDKLLLFVENFDTLGVSWLVYVSWTKFWLHERARPGEHLERHLPAWTLCQYRVSNENSVSKHLTNRRQFSMVYTLLLKTGSLYNAIRGILLA